MALKGIIFDLDGTLADTLPICIESYQRVFRKHLQREFTPEQVTATFGLPEEGILAELVPQNPQGALADYLAEYTDLHAGITAPFPGILTVLDRLKTRGLLLGMVTGKGPESAEISMERLGLKPYIDPVVTGDVEKPSKPEDIQQVLAAWGIDPQEAIYVGDTPYDMQSAMKAGVKPAGAAWADSATVQTVYHNGAVRVFKSIGELAAWIEEQL